MIKDTTQTVESIGDFFSENSKNFVSCQWKVNYVLSNSNLHRVMMPEIIIEMKLENGSKVSLTLSSSQFDELRRQVSIILRTMHQLEWFRYLNR